MDTSTAKEYTSKLRYPKIEHLGMSCPHGLMNIALINVSPGYEFSVIKQIDKKLEMYRAEARVMQLSYEQKTSSDKITPERSSMRIEGQDYSHAVHATGMGRFQLVTIFMGLSFGQCHFLSNLEHVNSFQVLLGGIPEPMIDKKLKYLRQESPNEFINPFDHYDCVVKETLPENVKNNPILITSQLQIDHIRKMLSPENIMLPLIYHIEKVIAGVADKYQEQRTEGLLVDSYSWSDYTLLLRSSNIENCMEIIKRIAAIKAGDILKTWQDLSTQVKVTAEFEDSLVNQPRAFVRRQQRFLKTIAGITGDFNSITEEQVLESNFFVTSSSLVGLLWPCAHFALQHKIQEEKNTGSEDFKANVYDEIKISGSAKGHVLITNEAGYGGKVEKGISSYIEKYGLFSHPELREVVTGGFGFNEIFSGHLLVGTNSDNSMQSKPDYMMQYCPFKKFIASLYHFRWKLLSEKCNDFVFKSSANKEIKKQLPWLCQNHLLDNWPICVRDVSMDIMGHMPLNENQSGESDHYLMTHIFNRFIAQVIDDNKKLVEDFLSKLKAKGIRRSIRNVIRQMLSIWKRELMTPQSAGNMIELIDVLWNWFKQIEIMTDSEDISIYEIDKRIRFLTQPFIQALEHRTLTGFYMSEHAELTTEFQGGLYNMITSLDGFVKAALSLTTTPYNTSGMSVIDHNHMASISIMSCHEKKRGINGEIKNQEYICAISRLNYTHMVHPNNISTVLHELIHVIVQSDDFKRAIESVDKDRILLDSVKPAYEDTPDDFIKQRRVELLVEYILGWLLFKDKPEIYSKCFLLQLSLNIESYAQDKKKVIPVFVEHICRCFVVENLLMMSDEEIAFFDLPVGKTFDQWWDKNCAYIFPRGVESTSLKEYVIRALSQWNASFLKKNIELVLKSTREYFILTCNKDSLRSQFLHNMRILQENETEKVVDMLFAKKPKPVHFVFNKNNENNTRCLWIRRMESLIGYLMLTRCYYIGLFDKFESVEKGDLFIKRKAGNVDFTDTRANGGYFLDQVGESLFTVGHASVEYFNVREAFLKSIWHMTEIMKLSSIQHIFETLKSDD